MTSTATTRESVSARIEQLKQEAEQAKKELNYEFAFVLLDQANALENELAEK